MSLSLLSATRFVLFLILLLHYHVIAQEISFYEDSMFVDFNYDLQSSVGPNNWVSVDTSNSEWNQYDEGHVMFDLGIPGDGEIEASMCGNVQGPFINTRDSPLLLKDINSCPDTHEMLTRQISEFDCGRDDLEFRITPYALRAYMPVNDDTCQRPTINLSGYSQDFILVWMEVHARSEHVLEGKRYDAELQMQHMGTGDANYLMTSVNLLVDASAKSEHEEFQFLLDGWQRVYNQERFDCNNNRKRLLRKEKGRIQETKKNIKKNNLKNRNTLNRNILVDGATSPCVASDKFGNGCEPLGPRQKMYPYNLWESIHYYGYRGSITTPPCADIVNHRTLDEPIKITKRQYKQLVNLLKSSRNDNCELDTRTSPTGENYRPLQPFNENDQQMYHCKQSDFGLWMYEPEEQ